MVCILLLQSCSTRQSDYGYETVQLIQTSRQGDRLHAVGTYSLQTAKMSGVPHITLIPDQTYQEIVGFGGSFTESVATLIHALPAPKQNEILKAYFSPEGAAYSLTRTHINSCDFSLKNYSYATVAGDTHLRHFSVEEDRDDLIPLIKKALRTEGANFKIIASPWTAPPWMKNNNQWNGGALKPEYYSTWALYFSKYIEAYRAEGIDIWGITVENEPLGNGDQWESMIFSPAEMRDFVKLFLGPQFEKDGISSRILIYDQNRDHVEQWAADILSDKKAAKYVWGTAVHWYSSTIDWYPESLNRVHDQFPGKQLLHTEGCIDSEIPVWQDDDWYWRKEATDWGYDWAPEEDKPLHPPYIPVYRYARDIIGGLNSWLAGWIDWNLVLNRQGGPNHARNWCIAPVIIDEESQEIYYTPLYYVLCHFSKYIRPGAFRIGVETEITELMFTAFRNVDNSVAVLILNQGLNGQEFQLNLAGKAVQLSIPPQSIQTLNIL
ncbi:MAG: glycoside hydrolase family 30 protein [bacterium]|nr:MAG: glycoside hydrolase family 30 protein [bacterium]